MAGGVWAIQLKYRSGRVHLYSGIRALLLAGEINFRRRLLPEDSSMDRVARLQSLVTLYLTMHFLSITTHPDITAAAMFYSHLSPYTSTSAMTSASYPAVPYSAKVVRDSP